MDCDGFAAGLGNALCGGFGGLEIQVGYRDSEPVSAERF
jgi:hypothetical protein